MADVLTPGSVMMMTDSNSNTKKKMDSQIPDPLPMQIPHPPSVCEYAVIIGSTESGYEIALALYEMGWNPVVLATNEIIPSYWTDCSSLQMDTKLQKLQLLRDQVTKKKIKIIPDNWIQEVECAGTNYEVFAVKSLQSSTIKKIVSMSLVLCSENEIRKYRTASKNHRGLFVCEREKDVPRTIEDVCFHLTMATGQMRNELVESVKIREKIPQPEPINTKLIPLSPPKKKLCPCC